MYRLLVLAGLAQVLLLAGCSLIGGATQIFGGRSEAERPGGYVVGDEPYAVRAGVAVLSAGGSAADAATATFFALAVTYPVAAGVGGGGLCIVRNTQGSDAEEFDFLARDAAQGGAYAVPGAVSGFAMMQARYGKLPWQRDVAAGEGLAATGFAISHALSGRLVENQNLVRLDAGLASEFLDESGQVKSEGTLVNNPALGQTLSTIRELGPSGFYQGSVASKIVAYSSSEGGAISLADLNAYAPARGNPAVMTIGSQTVFLPSRKTGAGQFTAGLLPHLVDAQGNVAAGDNIAAAVASSTKATMDELHLASLPRDLGATGFAATDANGEAVACAVTMNGPFGSGRTAADTGVVLAQAPASGEAGLAVSFLTPMVAESAGALSLAGAGAGGPNGSAAVALAVLKLARGIDISEPGQIHSTGLAPYDTVNVIACSNEKCVAVPDPGGSGLGLAAVGTR
jgi:gamma-glutamyltranspeptidase / glutathione hydrolase